MCFFYSVYGFAFNCWLHDLPIQVCLLRERPGVMCHMCRCHWMPHRWPNLSHFGWFFTTAVGAHEKSLRYFYLQSVAVANRTIFILYLYLFFFSMMMNILCAHTCAHIYNIVITYIILRITYTSIKNGPINICINRNNAWIHMLFALYWMWNKSRMLCI